MQQNLNDMSAVFQSRTFSEMVAAQSSLVRHNFEMMVENGQRIMSVVDAYDRKGQAASRQFARARSMTASAATELSRERDEAFLQQCEWRSLVFE